VYGLPRQGDGTASVRYTWVAMIQPDETRITTYHEAGHAVMAHLLGHQVLGCSLDGNDLGEGWVKLEDGNATVDRHAIESGAKIGLAAFAAENHVASILKAAEPSTAGA